MSAPNGTTTCLGAIGGQRVNKGGFSWKRALGVTRAKQRISRTTGIPLTKSGRQRKVGKMMTGGGCAIPGAMLIAVFLSVVSAI